MAGSVTLTMDEERIRTQQQRELQESRHLREEALRAAHKVEGVVAKVERMNRLYFERLHGTRGQR